MEVGLGLNEDCNAKGEKKIHDCTELLCSDILF
jgi:hypothetical protein